MEPDDRPACSICGRRGDWCGIVEEAVEAAKENAALNNLGNCKFIAGDVLKVLDDLTDKPDVIILDPPRDGIHPKALPKILSYEVDHIVYISCKATSLARDLPVFRRQDIRLRRPAVWINSARPSMWRLSVYSLRNAQFKGVEGYF